MDRGNRLFLSDDRHPEGRRARRLPVGPLLGLLAMTVLVPLVLLVGMRLRPATEGQASVPVVAPAHDIRAVDFGELTYPASAFACFSGPLAIDPHADSVTLHNGAASEPISHTELALRAVLYADVDADGSDDALVQLHCTAGASLSADAVSVYTATPTGSQLLATLPAPGPEVIGDFEPRVLDLAARPAGGLSVVWERWEAGQAHCCSGAEAEVHYRWDGSSLAAIAGVEVRPQRVF